MTPTQEQIFQRIMLKYLPHYYGDFPAVMSMMDAEAAESEAMYTAIEDILNQWHIDTATWSIGRWEEIYGIKTPVENPPSIEDRRAVVKVMMQSKRTMTKRDIEDMFRLYNGMEVEVTEDNPNSSVEIKFVDVRGVPGNLPDIQAQMRLLLPAHIEILYAFRWFLWGEWDAKNITWADMDGTGMTYESLEVWR